MGSGRTSIRPLVILVVAAWFGLVFSWAATVRAQDKAAQTPKARAADLYQQSIESYRKGDFKTTIVQLKEAYALDPQPVLVYNLARAYEGVGDTDAAIEAYSHYLELDPKAQDRGAIEQRIATLRRERDERIALQKQNDANQRAAQEQAARAAQQKKANETRKPHRRSAWPYVVGGVGLAGIAAGGVVGLMAVSEHTTARNERVQQTAADDQKKAQTFATASTVAFIGGGVLLAIGATWWILDTDAKPSRTTARARVGVSPGGLVLQGSFD